MALSISVTPISTAMRIGLASSRHMPATVLPPTEPARPSSLATEPNDSMIGPWQAMNSVSGSAAASP